MLIGDQDWVQEWMTELLAEDKDYVSSHKGSALISLMIGDPQNSAIRVT